MRPIGRVQSSLRSRDEAPRQGSEGAPEAWLELELDVRAGLEGIAVGDEVIATRSPDRPNPIGLHRVRVLEVAGQRIKVAPLEAIDGTPIVDIKPVLPIEDH